MVRVAWLANTDFNLFEKNLATALIKIQEVGCEIVDIKHSVSMSEYQSLASAIIIYKDNK